MTQLLGSVLEFWDTLRSTTPMLGKYNMYMTYFASKHYRRKISQESLSHIYMMSLHVQIYPLRLCKLWFSILFSHVLFLVINLYAQVSDTKKIYICRMVPAFTCTGLTETQYHGFTEAAGIGCEMDKTIDTSMWFLTYTLLYTIFTISRM